uniref:Uncharacterized protein n=1 Tax=Rhipicephalus appendiculatus TaxID=34631 RepID=A0A131YER0_RHIAP
MHTRTHTPTTKRNRLHRCCSCCSTCLLASMHTVKAKEFLSEYTKFLKLGCIRTGQNVASLKAAASRQRNNGALYRSGVSPQKSLAKEQTHQLIQHPPCVRFSQSANA